MEKASRTTVKPIVMTVRLAGRRMTLTWRPRKRVPGLLKALLARSLRSLAGVVLGGLSTAAFAQIAANALPTGGQLVAGQAVISQLSNQMLVSQGSDKAIINWNTFNIGSAAAVNFQMPASTSAVLNRVITNNPSSLLGTLTGNGHVWLINPAGIMVGPGATIDVGGFIGSTLNVRNEDFLADRLNFSGPGGVVSNFGRITTPQGGNVYLVGSSVENQGLIRSPGGKVLLAAGQTVEIGDTATPGVKVAITGTEGSVLNVGQVLAEAGRVGLAGVLVRNSGTINASSVVREGGRVFLRATKTVTTDADSLIDASGTTGGDIRLVAEERAQVNGSLVARGTEGRGGFVETSGKQGFSITRAPDVGPGGEWLIDPHNISIRAQQLASNVTDGPAFENTADDAVVTTDLLQAALDAGTNVSITTTAGGSQAGDINVHDAIVKSAGGDATLTLNAHNNINLDQAITATSGKLNVALSQAGTAALRSSIALNGGTLASSGRLVLSGATLDGVKLNTSGTGANSTIVTDAQTRFSGGTVWSNTGLAEFTNNGSLLLDAGTSFQNLAGGTVNLAGDTYAAIASSGGTMVNAGILNKMTPAVTVLEEFSNAGEVNVHAGTLRLAGNGKHGGSFNLLAGSDTMLSFAPGDGQTAKLDGATVNMQSSEGSGLVDFSGSYGSTTILNNDLALANARMTGGTLSGTGKLSVTNFVWSGGTITGSEGNPAYEFRNLSVGGWINLDGRTLNLVEGGSSSLNPGADMQLTQGAQLNLHGLMTVRDGGRIGANAWYDTGVSEINNFGQLDVANSAGSGGYANVLGTRWDDQNKISFNNAGTVNLSDALLLLGPGNHSGRFNLNATVPEGVTQLFFGNGNEAVTNFNAGASIAETAATGAKTFVTLAHGGGTTNLNTDLAVENASIDGGTLQGSGKLAVSSLDWSAGTIRGQSSDPAWDFGSINLTGQVAVDNRKIKLGAGGSSTAMADAGLSLLRGSVLTSNGSHSLGSISNQGSVLVASGTLSSTRLDNAGTIAVNGGSLTVDGMTTVDGILATSGDGSFTANGPLSGAGLLDVRGGSMTLNGPTQISDVSVSAGILKGSGGLSANNLFFTGGTISGSEPDPAYAINNLLLSGTATLEGRTLDLQSGGNSTVDGGVLWMSSGARINNAGTMSLSNGSFLGFPVKLTGDSEINNSGTIISLADSSERATNAIGGVAAVNESTTRFNNLSGGTVVVRDSTLELGPGTHNGSLQLDATGPGNARLTFYHYGGTVDLNAGTTISESRSNGGLTTVQFGSTSSSSSGDAAGITRVNTDLSVNSAVLASGTLAGSGSFRAANLAWSGGAIRGSAGDAAFEVGNLDTQGALALDGRTLNLLAGGTGSAAASSTLAITGSGVLNSAGNVSLGAIANAGSMNVSGGRLGAAGVSNTGLVHLANGATLAARDGFSNLESGLLTGSGTVDTGQNSLVNNGRMAPGGDAGIGTLAVQGNLQQGATGVTEIELAGNTQFDRVAASGQLALDGTLKVATLGGYAPAVGDSWSFLTGGGARSGSFSATQAPSGMRAGYSLFEGEAARLTMLPSTTTAYFNNAAGGLAWSEASNWAGNVRPGASDDVWIKAGSTISHAAGTDAIGKLTLAGATALSVSGGSISVGGLTSIDGRLTTTGSGTYTANGNIAGSGMLQVAGGNLVLNASASMPMLAISGGSVSGSGSLTVTREFSQTGGAINMPGAIVSLTQQTGNLVTGDITAGELELAASAGSIGQLAGTGALRADELETTSAAGTLLNNGGNKVRSFKAYNTGSGHISLVNVSSPSSLVLNGITNTAVGGNVSVDNTGGIVDNAPIVSRGKLALTAHSPITVNAPISAGSDVSLQAMSSTGGNDNLTINSSVSSTGGTLQLSAGGQLAVTSTGSLSVPGGSTISLTSTGGTVSIADPASIVGATPVVTLPAPVTAPPVSTAPTSTVLAAVTTIVGTAIKSANPTATMSNSIRNNTVVPTAPAAPSGSTSLASLGGQTVGGTVDTFGGASSTSGGDTGSGTGTASSTGFASTSSSPSSSSTQSSSAASDSSSSSSTSADGGSGSKKDEPKAKEDKPEAQKPQLASKQARKSLPVCN